MLTLSSRLKRSRTRLNGLTQRFLIPPSISVVDSTPLSLFCFTCPLSDSLASRRSCITLLASLSVLSNTYVLLPPLISPLVVLSFPSFILIPVLASSFYHTTLIVSSYCRSLLPSAIPLFSLSSTHSPVLESEEK